MSKWFIHNIHYYFFYFVGRQMAFGARIIVLSFLTSKCMWQKPQLAMQMTKANSIIHGMKKVILKNKVGSGKQLCFYSIFNKQACV